MDRLLPPKAEPYKPADWTFFQKTAFRFFFVFIGFQTLVAYNSFFIITDFHFITVSELMNIFSDVIFWMDRHFFHFGYNPDTDYAYFADPVYGLVIFNFYFFGSNYCDAYLGRSWIAKEGITVVCIIGFAYIFLMTRSSH